MQGLQQQEPQQPRESSRSRQLIFILIIYVLLVTSSRFGSKGSVNLSEDIVTQLKTAGQVPKVSALFSVFEQGKNYIGNWEKVQQDKQDEDGAASNNFQNISDFPEFQNSGKVKIVFASYSDTSVNFGIYLENGLYMDDGYLYSSFSLNDDNKKRFSVERQQNAAVFEYRPAKNSPEDSLPTTTYKIQKIFNTVEIGVSSISSVKFKYFFDGESSNSLAVSSEIATGKYRIRLRVTEQQSTMLKTIFFALIMFVVSYFTFSSVMHVLRRIIEGAESAERYSLLTVLTATLWDAVLCLVCFVQAFANEENLVLFILPSFMLCILFTNLELRWMLAIFQSGNSNVDLRSIICRFNLISYGSFLLVYPVLLFTNLSPGFFIAICLLFLPQIYLNAQKGIRPNLNSQFYSKFLMFRFLIIFYIRGFPYNVFELKPDYLLCLICLALIIFQYCLLWTQRVYGPKKVLPKFMLPPVFDYKYQEDEVNIELGEGEMPECAICLAPLHIEPQLQSRQNPSYLKNEYSNVRVMQTPCHHKYHSKCLIEWMNIKKECPQCRQTLPAFE